MSPDFRVPSGGFNEPSVRLFRKLPWEVRRAIASVQLRILSFVFALCPSAHVTSSFRSPSYTSSLYESRKQTPFLDSMHAWGALDFSRQSVDPRLLKSKAGEEFFVIDEPANGCVHVEVRS